MIEVHANLWVGNQLAYENQVCRENGWYVVQACKEPYHRRALGYSGRAVAKTHPEYLVALRDNRLILNMVDAEDPKYISESLVQAAIDYIDINRAAGHKVLVHCNKGQSRSPSIALMYLRQYVSPWTAHPLQIAMEKYRVIYPPFAPAKGIHGYLRQHWDKQSPS